jgi:hypothetical protein
MELTPDYILLLLGILLGVGFTLVGVAFTDHLQNRRHIIKLTKAFRNEVSGNLHKAIFNLNLLDDPITEHKGARHAFHTIAYEQLKLNVLLDWEKSVLACKIYDGFSFSMEYNKRIGTPKLIDKEMGSEKIILENIRDCMLYIDRTLKNISNIEKITNLQNK